MRMMKWLAAIIFAVALPCLALAQTSPNLSKGQVLTAGQWNALFAGKQDTLGYTPLNSGGGIMTGRLVTAASGAATAGLNITPGSVPASPVNGDFWATTAGFFGQVNGATVGPFAAGTSASFTGTSPIVPTFPGGGVVNYAFNFSVANTFLAQQTDQGATTTQPGWFVQVAGDTVPRIHLGLTTLDVPTISFGSGSATRDAFIQRVGPGSLRHGGPDSATAVAQTIGVQNVLAGTSNTAGANLTINGSQGTGTGAGGSIIFQVAPAGSTGSSQNTLSPALTINSAKLATFGGHISIEGVTSTGATGTGNLVFGTGPTFGGTILGTYTLGGTPTITAPTINAGALTGTFSGTPAFSGSSFITLANIVTGTQDTILGYFGSTAVSAIAPGNCSNALTYSTTTHAFGCNTTAGTGTVTSVTCFGVAITSTGTCVTTGQVPGIASNTAPSAGNVGEVINSCVAAGSAINLTSGTPVNVTSIPVTGGDWDIEGDIIIGNNLSTSFTGAGAFISDASATNPTAPNITSNFPDGGGMNLIRNVAAVFGATISYQLPTGSIRTLVGTTTTIYLVTFSNFTVSTASAYGCITARRRR